MFSLFKNSIHKINRILTTTNVSTIHLLAKPMLNNSLNVGFLLPKIQTIIPSCGFKQVGRVRRRCKDCYYIRREERLIVQCHKHPRHKQMSMKKDAKNTWILTAATQSKVRPWR